MTASERAKPDQILGDYRLLGFLGEGAAGEVHLAVPLKPKPFAKTDQLVAIKIYKPEILARHAQMERIQQEFKVGFQLSHPHLVRIFEYSPYSDLNRPFLVMEYVDGVTLDSWIPLFQPIPSRAIVRILLQVLSAVQELHKNGLIHRDIKPPNLMLTRAFDVMLMDFGVVQVTKHHLSKDSRLTPPNQFLGTIRNSSPEMLQGYDYDTKTDAYSVGTVLYSLLHGEEVFASESHFVRLSRLVAESEPPFDSTISSRDDTSAMLLRLTKNLLTKDPRNRPSIDEVCSLLDSAGISERDLPEPMLGYVATPLTNLPVVNAEANSFVSSLIAEVAKRYDIYAYQPRRATDPVRHPDVDSPTVHLLDRRQVARADVLFLVANEASFGAGQEVEIAASYNKPTIIVARKDTPISRMVLGSFARRLDLIYYETPEDFEAKLKASLSKHIATIRQAKAAARRVSSPRIGARLAELRHGRGYDTVEALGDAIGMAARTLSSLESGELDNPSVYVLGHIAKGLNVSLADLLSPTSVPPLTASADENLQSLEIFAKEQGISASDFFELRDDYARQLAAKGDRIRLRRQDWLKRHIALEERRFLGKGSEAEPDAEPGSDQQKLL
jgi:serine/threonine protein kinase/transcriptional regulator with XRE-family HTH domain